MKTNYNTQNIFDLVKNGLLSLVPEALRPQSPVVQPLRISNQEKQSRMNPAEHKGYRHPANSPHP